MSLRIDRPGLQTTLQAGPRRGQRHLGVPASGAADPLSLALANRLVGNPSPATGLEMTLAGARLVFETAASVAVTGADMRLCLNDAACPAHELLALQAGDRLDIGACRSGTRAYLAVAGGFAAQECLGSVSTYLPAGLGGHEGRALREGDRLEFAAQPITNARLASPAMFRPSMNNAWALRACAGAEAELLDDKVWEQLLASTWIVAQRADRMGLELSGPPLRVSSGGRMASSAVFPGTLQCPEGGAPFLLGVDAQTTGGYPRLLQVARCDRHLIGQLRPGDRLRFLLREPADAAAELRAKHDYWRAWLPDIDVVI